MAATSGADPIAPFLGRRLVQGVLLVNVLLWLLAAYFLGAARQGELETARLGNEKLALLVTRGVDSEYQKIDIALRTVVKDYRLHQHHGAAAVENWLRDLRGFHPGLSNLRIVTAAGDMIFAPEEAGRRLNIADRPYFQRLKALSEAGLQISGPVQGRITGGQVMLLARRLNDVDGVFSGVAVASISLDFFRSQLAALKIADGDAIALRDASMRTILRYPEHPADDGRDTSAVSNAVRAALREHPDAGSYTARSAVDGIVRLASYQRSSEFGYYVFIGSARERVLATWQRQLLVVVTLLVFFLLVSIGLARQLRRAGLRQRDAARVLAENERQLNEAQRIARLGYFSFDLRSETWEVSDTLAEIYGIGRDFPRDRAGWQAILHPDDAPSVLAHIRDDVVERQQPLDIVFRIRRQNDGEIRCLQARGRVERDPLTLVPRLFGSVQDITDRRRAEEQLAQSEARFRAFFDNALIGMAITSVDQEWLQVNPALCRILGYPREVLVTKTWAELTHPDDLPRNETEFARAMRGEVDGYLIEKRYLRADGEVIHAHVASQAVRRADGTVEFFSTSVEDVSDRVRFEQQLFNNRELLRQFLDHLPATAYVKDENLRLRMANREFIGQLGLDPEKVIGSSNTELIPGPFGEKISLDDRRVLASGRTEMIQESFDGRYFETIKFVIHQQSGRLLGGITFDVSARHAAENALQDQLAAVIALNQKLAQAQNQLLQSEKMATIGQLAAGVAHELNNPIGFIQSNLGALSAYVDDLLDLIDLGERCAERCAIPQLYEEFKALTAVKDLAFIRQDVRQLLDESKDGADRVRRIVQNLKDFSHVSEDEWLWADLHQGLDSTLTIVWNEIKYKAELDKRYGQLPEVFCMPAQLNQVFMNLLVNAAQAIEERGKITLLTGVEPVVECAGDPAGTLPPRRVWVEIRDTGKGIPAENLSRIFDPFFTTKPVGQGTGLGLSLAWSIVQKHHGQLSVDSKVGSGTCFRITLPVDAREVGGEPE